MVQYYNCAWLAWRPRFAWPPAHVPVTLAIPCGWRAQRVWMASAASVDGERSEWGWRAQRVRMASAASVDGERSECGWRAQRVRMVSATSQSSLSYIITFS